MNISFNDTVRASKRRTRALFMILAACALSALNIFIEKIYAQSEKALSSYDPFSLYFITFVASTVLLSCALTVLSYENKHYLWIAPAVSAVIIAALYILLGASPASVLLSLAFIPSATVISVCISHGCEKAHTVVAGATVIGTVFLLALLLDHYAVFGEISKGSLTYTLNLLRDSFLEFYKEYNYAGLGINASMLSSAFDAAILMTPSLLCALAAVVSYITASISRLTVLGQGALSEKLLYWPLKMSRLASFVFLSAFLIAALSASGENAVIVLSAINVMIALLPGFFLIGVRSSFMHVRKPGFFGMIFGIFLLISCIQNPAMILVIVATLGAIDNLFSSYRARLYGEIKK